MLIISGHDNSKVGDNLVQPFINMYATTTKIMVTLWFCLLSHNACIPLDSPKVQNNINPVNNPKAHINLKLFHPNILTLTILGMISTIQWIHNLEVATPRNFSFTFIKDPTSNWSSLEFVDGDIQWDIGKAFFCMNNWTNYTYIFCMTSW